MFEQWRAQFSNLEIIALTGNHDILPHELYKGIQIRVLAEFREGPFLFRHHPSEIPEENFVFCGHVHPVFALHAKARQTLRFPCFVVDDHQMILPSFGVFTGGYGIEAMVSRRIYIVADQKVFNVRD